MKKYLLLLLVGILALVLLTSCKNDSLGADWYKDWLWAKTWGSTAPKETTDEPEDTTKPLELVTDPVEVTPETTETPTEPPETTTEPAETSNEPEETTTKPAETTTTPVETTEADGGYDWGYDPYDPPVPGTTVKPAETTEPKETTTEPKETTTEPKETTTEPEQEAEIYTITYVLNGGKLPAGATYTFTSETKTTLPTPTSEGNTFVGWYETSDFSGNAVTEIAVGTVGNKTFYAKWKTAEPGLWFPIIPLPSGRDK